MNRVTATDVRAIFETDLLDPVLETFITVANGIVTGYLGATTLLTDDEKKTIEQFLAAHLASTMRDPQAKSEGVSAAGAGVTSSYHGVTGLGLDASMFGQTVKLLDRTRILALMKRAPSVFAVPSFKSRATPSVSDV